MIEKKYVLNNIRNLMFSEYVTEGHKNEEVLKALDKVCEMIEAMPEERSFLCDFYVKDKTNGRVHRVGDNAHDSIWVDSDGQLHYHNLQNGDGCSGQSCINDDCGYEFVPSDCGVIEGEE